MTLNLGSLGFLFSHPLKFGHPLKVTRISYARVGSWADHDMISAAEVSEQDSSSNTTTVSAGSGAFDGLSNNERRLINPRRIHHRVTVIVLGAYVCYYFNCYIPCLQVESKVPFVFS